MIKILTDSTADLSPELIARYKIEKIPLYVFFGEECFRDGVDFTYEEFWQKLKSTDVFPVPHSRVRLILLNFTGASWTKAGKFYLSGSDPPYPERSVPP